jgi:hypothetical protein
MERIVMSHLGDVVWLSHDPSGDPMGEFGAEDDQATRPLPASLFKRVAAVSRIAIPQAPAPEALPSAPAEAIPVPAAEPPLAPVEAIVAAVVPPSTASRVRAALTMPRRRWVVGVAVAGLVVVAQGTLAALWAWRAVADAAPIAIQLTRPPVPFAAAVAPLALPNERTIVPPPRPVAAAPKAVPAGPQSGWLHLEVPVALRIVEDGRLLGTSDVDRLMLPAGEHVLDLRNDELQFATRLMVAIKTGETAIVPVRLPSASISINAKPWAEAWVDGERVGETPIGTLTRTIGRHEVVLRHPELGERRVPVLVTLAQPARVIVDFKAGK